MSILLRLVLDVFIGHNFSITSYVIFTSSLQLIWFQTRRKLVCDTLTPILEPQPHLWEDTPINTPLDPSFAKLIPFTHKSLSPQLVLYTSTHSLNLFLLINGGDNSTNHKTHLMYSHLNPNLGAKDRSKEEELDSTSEVLDLDKRRVLEIGGHWSLNL